MLSALGRLSDIDAERALRNTIGTQLGPTSFVETPPGHVLTRLTHAAAPASQSLWRLSSRLF